MRTLDQQLRAAIHGERIEAQEAYTLLEQAPLEPLLHARRGADAWPASAQRVTYSRKVFIPLTQLCRDVCHYCTFAQRPAQARRRRICRSSRCSRSRAPERRAGCKEALFTLGDKPELRYAAARARARRSSALRARSSTSSAARGWCSRRPVCCRT